MIRYVIAILLGIVGFFILSHLYAPTEEIEEVQNTQIRIPLETEIFLPIDEFTDISEFLFPNIIPLDFAQFQNLYIGKSPGGEFLLLQEKDDLGDLLRLISLSEICENGCRDQFIFSENILIPLNENFRAPGTTLLSLEERSGILSSKYIQRNISKFFPKLQSDIHISKEGEKTVFSAELEREIALCDSGELFSLDVSSTEKLVSGEISKCGVALLHHIAREDMETSQVAYRGISQSEIPRILPSLEKISIEMQEEGVELFFHGNLTQADEDEVFKIVQNITEEKDSVRENLPDGTFYTREIFFNLGEVCKEGAICAKRIWIDRETPETGFVLSISIPRDFSSEAQEISVYLAKFGEFINITSNIENGKFINIYYE